MPRGCALLGPPPSQAVVRKEKRDYIQMNLSVELTDDDYIII